MMSVAAVRQLSVPTRHDRDRRLGVDLFEVIVELARLELEDETHAAEAIGRGERAARATASPWEPSRRRASRSQTESRPAVLAINRRRATARTTPIATALPPPAQQLPLNADDRGHRARHAARFSPTGSAGAQAPGAFARAGRSERSSSPDPGFASRAPCASPRGSYGPDRHGSTVTGSALAVYQRSTNICSEGSSKWLRLPPNPSR